MPSEFHNPYVTFVLLYELVTPVDFYQHYIGFYGTRGA